MEEMDQHLPLGEFIGHLKIESVLGAGGFGVTYKAFDPNLEKYFAVKEYLPADLTVRHGDSQHLQARTGRADDFKFGLERFLDEARALARFNHSNICQVSQFIQANNTAYLVMNYEPGEALDDYLKRIKFQGQMPELEILSIIQPILRGLDAVHKEGLLHRDIKPGNIYLRQNGEPMLIDFGAARYALGEHSKSISAIISMGYAPPEQYTSRGKQGPWTDLYAIGATLYQLISGKPPLESMDRQLDINDEQPDPLLSASEIGAGKYSENLLQAIDWCLQLKSSQRPHSAEQLLAALSGEKADANESKTVRISSGEHFPSKSKHHGAEKADSDKPQQAAARSGFWVVLIALIFALSGVAYFVYTNVTTAQEDKQAWFSSRDKNTINSAQDYLAQWPDGQYREEAKQLIAQLQDRRDRIEKIQKLLRQLGHDVQLSGQLDSTSKQAIRDVQQTAGVAVDTEPKPQLLQWLQHQYDDVSSWQHTQAAHSIAAYQNYLDTFGGGQFRTQAKLALDQIKEEQSWLDSKKRNTQTAYQAYINAFPSGKYLSQAKRRIQQLEDQKKRLAKQAKAKLVETKAQKRSRLLRVAQAEFIRLGYPGITVNGQLDTATKEAVKLFSKRMGLDPDRDSEERFLKVLKSTSLAQGAYRSQQKIIPIVKIQPRYPTKAARDGIEGYVEVELDVDQVGNVQNARVVKSEPAGVFDRESLRAVRKFKYRPLTENGEAKVRRGVKYRFDFNLQ